MKVLKALDLGILKPPSIICVSYDMALKIMKKIVIWSIQMKILERRDPKKKQKRRKIEPLPFLRSSYSAAEIPENKYVNCSHHVITKNPIPNSVFSYIF